ncbi:MAG: hypothetical protein AAF657_06675 [Acidobacteriota bacterium]
MKTLRLQALVAALAFVLAGCGQARDWSAARRDGSIAAYERYLELHPEGRFAAEAQAILAEKVEALAWQRAQRQDSVSAYRAYLEAYPEGRFVAESWEGLSRVWRQKALARSLNAESAGEAGSGFFQNLSEPRAAENHLCPYGHEDVAWVPIRYGLFSAEETAAETRQAIYAGCVQLGHSPTAALVCQTCGFTYESDAETPYWLRSSSDFDSFAGRLMAELGDFADAAEATLSLAAPPVYAHGVAAGETLRQSVAFAATDGVEQLVDFASQFLADGCSNASRAEASDADGVAGIEFACSTAWRHYELRIRNLQPAAHRLRLTVREVDAGLATRASSSTG